MPSLEILEDSFEVVRPFERSVWPLWDFCSCGKTCWVHRILWGRNDWGMPCRWPSQTPRAVFPAVNTTRGFIGGTSHTNLETCFQRPRRLRSPKLVSSSTDNFMLASSALYAQQSFSTLQVTPQVLCVLFACRHRSQHALILLFPQGHQQAAAGC